MACGQRRFFSPGRPVPSAARHRPPGGPTGAFAGVFLALVGGLRGLSAVPSRRDSSTRAPCLKREIVRTTIVVLTGFPQARGQRPWGEVLFRRRPRSRRSSNEVAPSAGGGGGARDLRSRFSSSSPVRRGVGGGRHGELPAKFQADPVAVRSIAWPLRCRWALQPGFCRASRGWATGRTF